MVFNLVVLMVAIVVAYYVGKSRVPKPMPPAPKRFGYSQAERLSAEIGGLTPQLGKTVEIAARVGGLDFVVREESAVLVEDHTRRAELYKEKAEDLRSKAAAADLSSIANKKIATDVVNLAANFAK